jgi:uncharacterized protein YwgA
MAQNNADPAAWILAAAAALNRHASWTGRVHIHKHLFIAQVLALAEPPFEFSLYDYGPYSFELDQAIIDLELLGQLDRSYPQPGYGPRYEPTPQGLAVARTLGKKESEVVESVAAALGSRKSQDLELIATCLWVQHREHITDDAAVVQRVHQAKPKYNNPEIEAGLSDARKVCALLAA